MSDRGTMEARLIVVGGRATKKEIPLRLPVRVGRSPKADVTILHPLVSRRHCEIFERDGELVVRDTGSANGTYVEGERVDEAVLRSGNRLTIGPLTFKAVWQATEAEAVGSNGSAPSVAAEAVSDEVDEITLDEPLDLSAGDAEAVAEPSQTAAANAPSDDAAEDLLPLDALDVEDLLPEDALPAAAEEAEPDAAVLDGEPIEAADARPAAAMGAEADLALSDSSGSTSDDADAGEFDFLEFEASGEPQTEPLPNEPMAEQGSHGTLTDELAGADAGTVGQEADDGGLDSSSLPEGDDIDLDALPALDEEPDVLGDFDALEPSERVDGAEADESVPVATEADQPPAAPLAAADEPGRAHMIDGPEIGDDLPEVDDTLNVGVASGLQFDDAAVAPQSRESSPEAAKDEKETEGKETAIATDRAESSVDELAGEAADELPDVESIDDTELAALEEDEELGLLLEDMEATAAVESPAGEESAPVSDGPSSSAPAVDDTEDELLPIDAVDELADLEDLELPEPDDELEQAARAIAADETESSQQAAAAVESAEELPAADTVPPSHAASADEPIAMEATGTDEGELDALDVEEFEELDDAALMSLEEDEPLLFEEPEPMPEATGSANGQPGAAAPVDDIAQGEASGQPEPELETAEISEDDIFEFLSEGGESAKPASKSDEGSLDDFLKGME